VLDASGETSLLSKKEAESTRLELEEEEEPRRPQSEVEVGRRGCFVAEGMVKEEEGTKEPS